MRELLSKKNSVKARREARGRCASADPDGPVGTAGLPDCRGGSDDDPPPADQTARDRGAPAVARLGQRAAQVRLSKGIGTRAPILVEAQPNARWSLDFVHDQLAYGRQFRILNVVDDVTRECLALAIGRQTTTRRSHIRPSATGRSERSPRNCSPQPTAALRHLRQSAYQPKRTPVPSG